MMATSIFLTMETQETSVRTASASGCMEYRQVSPLKAISEGGNAFEFDLEEVPDDFWRGLADIDAGRHVDLDTALNEPATDAEL